jgi:hypothetical protein
MIKESMIAIRPKLEKMVRASNIKTIKVDAVRTTAAGKIYRAKIESLLEKAEDEPLTDVWQRVSPFPITTATKPNRRGIIRDLVDFAVVLQPRLDGMKAHRLCRLIEKYAAYVPRPPDVSVSRLA